MRLIRDLIAMIKWWRSWRDEIKPWALVIDDKLTTWRGKEPDADPPWELLCPLPDQKLAELYKPDDPPKTLKVGLYACIGRLHDQRVAVYRPQSPRREGISP